MEGNEVFVGEILQVWPTTAHSLLLGVCPSDQLFLFAPGRCAGPEVVADPDGPVGEVRFVHGRRGRAALLSGESGRPD